jgi:hypothetical protein
VLVLRERRRGQEGDHGQGEDGTHRLAPGIWRRIAQTDPLFKRKKGRRLVRNRG